MLTILAQQRAHLALSQERFFYSDCARRLAVVFPAAFSKIEASGHDRFVASLCASARRRRLFSARDLFLYCGFVLEFGEDFESDPAMTWATGVLDCDGPGRMDRVIRLARARCNAPPPRSPGRPHGG